MLLVHTEPIDRAGLMEKFHGLAGADLGAERAEKIERAVFGLDEEGQLVSDLAALLYEPPAFGT